MSERVEKRWVHAKRSYMEAWRWMSGGRRDSRGCVKGDLELIRIVRYPHNRKVWEVQYRGHKVDEKPSATQAKNAAENYWRNVQGSREV